MHEWRVCSSDRGAEMCDRSPHLTRSPREGSKPHSSMRYLTIFLWPWTTALWRQFWPKLSRSNLLSPKRFTRYFTDDSLPLIAANWRALSRSCMWGIEPSYHLMMKMMTCSCTYTMMMMTMTTMMMKMMMHDLMYSLASCEAHPHGIPPPGCEVGVVGCIVQPEG